MENLTTPRLNFCYVQWQRLWTLRIFALRGNPFLLLSYSLLPSFSRFWRKRGKEINPAMHHACRWAEWLITSPRPVLGGAKSHWSHPAAPGLGKSLAGLTGAVLWEPREGLSILRADPFSWGFHSTWQDAASKLPGTWSRCVGWVISDQISAGERGCTPRTLEEALGTWSFFVGWIISDQISAHERGYTPRT